MNQFKVYCGPTLVAGLAERLRPYAAHLLEGTEHVYVTTAYTVNELLVLLNQLMSGFTMRDVQHLGTSNQ